MANEERIRRARMFLVNRSGSERVVEVEAAFELSEEPELLADFAESELADAQAEFREHGLKCGLLANKSNPDARAIAERIVEAVFIAGDGNRATHLKRYFGELYMDDASHRSVTTDVTKILSTALPAWVSVSTLPEADGAYLIASKMFPHPRSAHYISRKEIFVTQDGAEAFEMVTHWMKPTMPEGA